MVEKNNYDLGVFTQDELRDLETAISNAMRAGASLIGKWSCAIKFTTAGDGEEVYLKPSCSAQKWIEINTTGEAGKLLNEDLSKLIVTEITYSLCLDGDNDSSYVHAKLIDDESPNAGKYSCSYELGDDPSIIKPNLKLYQIIRNKLNVLATNKK